MWVGFKWRAVNSIHVTSPSTTSHEMLIILLGSLCRHVAHLHMVPWTFFEDVRQDY